MLTSVTQADVIFSEYIEGSGYNKALELYNSGSESVDLSEYTIELYSNGSYTAGATETLSGSLAAGEYYVIAYDSDDPDDTDTAITSIANITSSVTNFNGDDVLLLKQNDTVTDRIGQLGTEEDFAVDVTLVRKGTITSGDSDYEAEFTVSDEWIEYDKDTFDYLGNGDGSDGSTAETDLETAPDYAEELTIMQVQGSGDYSPYIDSDTYSGEIYSDDYYKVTGIVTGIQDDSSDAVLEDKGFFIQDETGDDDETTSDGIYVFYDDVADLDLSIGDEVSVYGSVKENYSMTGLAPVYVELTGNTGSIEVTPLRSADSDEDFEETLERYEGMYVLLDEEADMLITRTFSYDYDGSRDNMVVSHGDWNVNPNQYNSPGSEDAVTQSENNALNRLFIESMNEAEDGIPWYSTFQDDTDLDGSADEYLRVGAVVDGMTGFIGYSYYEYRFYVEKGLDLNSENFIYASGYDRTEEPELLDGDLRIATFNVLNYFNSEVGGNANPTGENRGAETTDDFNTQTAKIVSAITAIDADIVGLMEIENNGFDEYSAVSVLVDALNEELEEDDQYSYVAPDGYDYIGTDSITNAIIYRASTVSLDEVTVIEMPEQHAPAIYSDEDSDDILEDGDNYQRDALTPTFTHIDSGEQITVSVNHLKSKGSSCYDDFDSTGEETDEDLQGYCEALRVSGAYYLAEQLNDMDGYKLIIGDLNSYGSEDPILLLTNQDNAAEGYEINAAAYTYIGGEDGEVLHGEDGAVLTESYGYLNLVELFDAGAYSYSYDDEVGTLDYILGSADIEDVVVDAMYWNINAGESNLFEYDYSYGDVTIYEDAYRSSDHDPAIVVLDFDHDESTDDGSTDDGSTDDSTDDESSDEDDDTSAGSFDPFTLLGMLSLLGFGIRRRRNLA
jgi:predicted extracellular nuclease